MANASTVYEISQLLPKEERMRLFNMLKDELRPEEVSPKIKKMKKRKTIDYTEEDALAYLFNALKI
ncbi:hypothetical protein [Mangrovimonas sp. TPBH4]|nr:hypothetical protein [Mangrovimonas sp. TPBH4]